MPNYNTITNWVPVTMRDHLCAFASFVPLIEQCTDNPALGVNANNPFIHAYFAALPQTRTHYKTSEYGMELAKAAAVKAAYAATLLADNSFENPFITLLDAALTEINLEPKDTHELKDRLVNQMVDQHAEEIFLLYDSFKEMIDLDVDSDEEVLVEDKFALKESRYTQGLLFRTYIQSVNPELITSMKKFYVEQLQIPENIYAARTNEIAYMATQLKCVSTLTVFQINKPNNNAEVRPEHVQEFQFDINPAGVIPMVFRNMNYHWEAAKLELGRLACTLVIYTQQTLLSIFDKKLLESPKLQEICLDEDAELNRIARLGQEFIIATSTANDAIDNTDEENVRILLSDLSKPKLLLKPN